MTDQQLRLTKMHALAMSRIEELNKMVTEDETVFAIINARIQQNLSVESISEMFGTPPAVISIFVDDLGVYDDLDCGYLTTTS